MKTALYCYVIYSKLQTFMNAKNKRTKIYYTTQENMYKKNEIQYIYINKYTEEQLFIQNVVHLNLKYHFFSYVNCMPI